jgi:hypothetical protein
MPRLAPPSLAALLAALPLAAQEAPVRAVTLFEAGLAELTRDAGGAEAVTLRVPLRDVNDVLKSLLVRGEGITGASLVLDGATPVEDAFAALPFPPEAATDLAALLRAVPGLRVRIADRAYPDGVEGTLMAAQEDCAAERGCRTVLTLVSDGGALTRHVFGEGTAVTLLDPEMAGALARGLGALRAAASGTLREVTVRLDNGDGEAALSYVVAAPAWKTAYRALTGPEGGVALQAWAVVENATSEDWEDVALTLSSGSPRTLAADLHGRTWRSREMVEAEMPVPVMPAAPMALAADSFAERAAGAPAPSPIAAQAEGSEGVLDSRFAFPFLVDLGAGQMLSLPFLTDALEARHLSLWRGAAAMRTGNPDMVLEVTNDLDVRLPAGIMTVSDEDGGYVGDAAFPLVAPGETRAVPFGLDRRLRVEETATLATPRVSVKASSGVLRIASQEVRETTYAAIAPAGEPRELVIDHPLRAGWTTEVRQGPDGTARQDEAGARWLRLTLPVPGEGAARAVLRDMRPIEEVIEVGTLPEADLLVWAGQAAAPEDRAYLEEAARLRTALARAEEAARRAEQERMRLVGEQDRIRVLLGTVPAPSETHDRFLADLVSLEERIAGATEAAAEARAAAEAAQAAFRAHLAEE